jgi:biopolymer transport protein ExbD
MSMNVGSPDGEEDAVISAINTTPLVDVMLVMLIIFLITIPVVTTSIPVTCPKNGLKFGKPNQKTSSFRLTPQAASSGTTRRSNVEALVDKLKKVSTVNPQPEVQIRGDMASRYEGVGKILYACQRAGIVKVAFITEPPALGG